MKYCTHCQKLVNVREHSKYWNKGLFLIIGTCENCHSFLYQYLKNKKDD